MYISGNRLCSGIYFLRFTSRARKAHKNVENAEKIKLGTSVTQLKFIMGKPDSIYPAYFDITQRIDYYEPPSASSPGIEIYVDSTEKVVKITPFE